MRISDMILSNGVMRAPNFWMIDTPDDRAMGIVMFKKDFFKYKAKLGRYGMIMVQKLLMNGTGNFFDLYAMSVRIVEDEDVG